MRALARGGRRFRLRGRVVGRLAGFGRVSVAVLQETVSVPRHLLRALELCAADVVGVDAAAERGRFDIAQVAGEGLDVFTGAALGEGKKSVALSVTLQPSGHTMTDAEIDAVAAKIVANVQKQTGAVLRG